MVNLAAMFDYGINRYGMKPTLFHYRFIVSGVAELFGTGNPRYVAGLSGIELADIVIERTGGDILPGIYKVSTIEKSPEFWAGWVLAYYQWKSNKTFAQIERNGLGIDKIITMYHPLHESDPDKFADVADSIIQENGALKKNRLKEARERIGLTQKGLSESSGISLRMIRAYEQGQQELICAEYRTVSLLAHALNVSPDTLL